MTEAKLQELVEAMTEERYEEIREGLQALRLVKSELLAWLQINKSLNTYGANHQFAPHVDLETNPLAEHD